MPKLKQKNKHRATPKETVMVSKAVEAEQAAPAAQTPVKALPYPEFAVRMMFKGSPTTARDGSADGPINAAKAKVMLKWEPEANYKKRIAAAKNISPDAIKLDENDALLTDLEDVRVACWNTTNNRPFDLSLALTHAQDILQGNWAGPTNFPGDTVNGETIILAKTGEVHQGVHRLVGVVLADQMWRGKDAATWQAIRKTEPVLETLMVVGVSSNPKIVRTIDNTRPRTEADVIYTSPIYADLGKAERKECSNMQAKAIDLLWTRTKAEKAGTGVGAGEDSKLFKTHSMALTFRDDHHKLLECVKSIFGINKKRQISRLRISAGRAAGFLYLMGSSASDGDAYAVAEKRSEKLLSWDNWELAEDFWQRLADPDDSGFQVVRDALGSLATDEDGLGGRTTEKDAVIVKAWQTYLADSKAKIKLADVQLTYHEDSEGIRHLVDDPSCGGIDFFDNPEVGAPALSEAEVEENKKVARQKIYEEEAKKIAAKTPDAPTTLKEELRNIKASNGDALYFFRLGKESYQAWGDDAAEIAKAAKVPAERMPAFDNLLNVRIKGKQFDEVTKLLSKRNRPWKIAKVLSGNKIQIEK